MSWELIVKRRFSAAHFLEHYRGKCEHMHGHTFLVEAHFAADALDRSGIAIDFSELKRYLKEMLPDHKVLNEVLDGSPSAENLARHFFRQIRSDYPSLKRVVVWESEEAGAAYSE